MKMQSLVGTGRGVGRGWLGCAVVALLAVGCTGAPSGPGSQGNDQGSAKAKGGKVLASYGGKTFTDQDLLAQIKRLNVRSRKGLVEDTDRRVQFVENYVITRLIYNEGKRRGFDRDEQIRRQVEDLERRLVIQKVLQEKQSAPVADKEVRAYYDTHQDEFRTDRVRASHILVKDEKLAHEIHEQLVKDPSLFASLAEQHSIDRANSKRGGDLGFFGHGRMVKEFDDAAFGLSKDGQISDVVHTRFGYHIIQRTGREEGTIKPFDDVKNQIRVRMVNDKRRANTAAFIETLKQQAGYKIDRDAVAQLDLSSSTK